MAGTLPYTFRIHQDGIVTIKYNLKLTSPGEHWVSLLLDDQHVRGSPFKCSVEKILYSSTANSKVSSSKVDSDEESQSDESDEIESDDDIDMPEMNCEDADESFKTLQEESNTDRFLSDLTLPRHQDMVQETPSVSWESGFASQTTGAVAELTECDHRSDLVDGITSGPKSPSDLIDSTSATFDGMILTKQEPTEPEDINLDMFCQDQTENMLENIKSDDETLSVDNTKQDGEFMAEVKEEAQEEMGEDETPKFDIDHFIAIAKGIAEDLKALENQKQPMTSQNAAYYSRKRSQGPNALRKVKGKRKKWAMVGRKRRRRPKVQKVDVMHNIPETVIAKSLESEHESGETDIPGIVKSLESEHESRETDIVVEKPVSPVRLTLAEIEAYQPKPLYGCPDQGCTFRRFHCPVRLEQHKRIHEYFREHPRLADKPTLADIYAELFVPNVEQSENETLDKSRQLTLEQLSVPKLPITPRKIIIRLIDSHDNLDEPMQQLVDLHPYVASKIQQQTQETQDQYQEPTPVQPNTPLGYYKCPADHCGRNFKSTLCLERHLAAHIDLRLFLCPEEGCTKRFTSAKHLHTHSLGHLGETYKCDICDREYSTRNHLSKHIEHHTSVERKYHCDVPGCGSSFKMHKYLNQHRATHRTTFEFLCQFCGKQFKRSECLRSHLLSKLHQE